jgi:hypothetical protein
VAANPKHSSNRGPSKEENGKSPLGAHAVKASASVTKANLGAYSLKSHKELRSAKTPTLCSAKVESDIFALDAGTEMFFFCSNLELLHYVDRKAV